MVEVLPQTPAKGALLETDLREEEIPKCLGTRRVRAQPARRPDTAKTWEQALRAHDIVATLYEGCLVDVVPMAVAAAFACLFTRRRQLRYLSWLVADVVVDDVIALLPLLLRWNFGQWNWIGQGLSLLFSLAVARLCFTREAVGWRLPRSRSDGPSQASLVLSPSPSCLQWSGR